MSSFLTGLLANLAVVAVVIVLWTIVRDGLPKLAPRSQSLVYGTFMGAGAIASMLLPQQIAPGMFADMRTGLVAVAGFFEGPLAALAAGAIACLWRAGVGGVGAASGCLGIAIVAVVAVAGRALLRQRPIRERDILFLAVGVSITPNLAIVALPKDLWPLATAHIEAVLGMTLVATTLAGLAILQDRRRRDLLEKDRIYRAIIETLPDCLNVKDLDGRFIAANPATARLMRAGMAADLVGKTDFDFYPEEIARGFRSDELHVVTDKVPHTIDQRVAFDDGSNVWLSTLKAPLYDEKGRAIGVITHNRDVTAQHALQEELRVTELQLEDALEHMADGLVLYDKSNRIVLCNRQYLQLFPLTSDIRRPGVHLAEILRTSLARGESRLAPGIEAEDWIAERCRVNAFPGDRVIELLDGRWIEARTRSGSGGGALSLLTDITERRRTEDKLAALNAQLAELALTDGLTGICNRRGLDQALAKEFARGARDGTPLSVLLFDVDHFKAYNDSYGHWAGDECLVAIANELRAVIRRPSDLAARYGGEEFAVILPNTSPNGALELAERLRCAVKQLRMPHKASEFGVVTISVGVTTHVPGLWIKQLQGLMSRADAALYEAKAAGRDRVQVDPRSADGSLDDNRLAAAS
jgi:diguanylate cyclase (GGDEF)-like protein/PAS domain S-box-containing protein